MKNWRVFLTVVLLLFLLAPVSAANVPAQQDALRQEEREDYYKRWLDRDVIYIITPDEKSVFSSLTTPEEKEQFIEQFWRRRDPDPRTGHNEYKEEHYRRIAYANDHFHSGVEGWYTDRGKIYIKFGPPQHREEPHRDRLRAPHHRGRRDDHDLSVRGLVLPVPGGSGQRHRDRVRRFDQHGPI